MNTSRIKAYKCVSNEATLFFDKLNIFLYICGLPDFWIGDLKLSKKFMKIYDQISISIHCVMVIFLLSVTGSLFTQKNMSTQQLSDTILVVIVSAALLFFYCNMLWYREPVRTLLYHLAVVLRTHYNDNILEKEMVGKIRLSIVLFVAFLVLFLSLAGLVALVNVLTADMAFIPVITAWPDIADRSKPAEAARVAFYMMWWLNTFRCVGSFILLLTIMNSICYQYRNLQSFFYNMSRIFCNQSLLQSEKERKYEEEFKMGIYLHIVTIWCTKQYEIVCNNIFSLEITICLSTLVTVLPQLLNKDHDAATTAAAVPMAAATLLTLGFFMWTGGDITVEAFNLSEAMYMSGWENCYGKSSLRIRNLVVIGLAQAQRPVVLQAFGIVDLSYTTYVKVIKTSYSIVSVFY